MQDIGLYYPYLHFRDEAWLKGAVLYWDRVDRILPAFPEDFLNFAPDDSDAVVALKGEGYIGRIVPSDEAKKVGTSFLELIKQHEEALRAKYDVSKVSEWEINPEPERVPVNEPLPEDYDCRFAYIAEGKMPHALHDALVETGLAIKGVYEAGLDFLGMHPKLASIYMTSLAEEITAGKPYQPITENPKLHIAVSDCTMERIAQALLGDENSELLFADSNKRQDEAETFMASFCLQTVMPKNIESLEVRKIIDFKKTRRDEMRNFRRSLEDFVINLEWLEGVKNQNEMQKALKRAYDARIAPQLKEAESFFRTLGGGTVLSTIALSPASLPNSLGSLLNIPLEPIAAGLAIAMLPVLYGARWMAREKVGSIAYLLHVKEGLNPSTMRQRILRGARDFCFDVRQI
ncbi:MAG TPA: DUF6236 family protein [Pyrinomonadaceae bacterium]|jgi:hypothetical protein|nr:DUF6236 family protein [Pyrinomonadaceae bacterium]